MPLTIIPRRQPQGLDQIGFGLDRLAMAMAEQDEKAKREASQEDLARFFGGTLGPTGAGTGFAGSPELAGQTNLGTPGLIPGLSPADAEALVIAMGPEAAGRFVAERLAPAPISAVDQARLDLQREGLGLEREGMKLKREQFSSDQEFNRAKLALEERKISADQAGAGAAKLSDIGSFRGQYTGLSENFLATRDAYGKLRSAAVADPSAASDIALISGYMKILDPTSIVREGEYATAANAGGIPDIIRNTWNRLVDGTRLTPEQRADFVNQGHGLFTSALQQQEELQQSYRGIASRMAPNVLPDDAVPDFIGTSREWAAMPSPPPRPEQGLVDQAVGAVEGAAEQALAQFGVPPVAQRVAGQRYRVGTRELTWDGSRWQE